MDIPSIIKQRILKSQKPKYFLLTDLMWYETKSKKGFPMLKTGFKTEKDGKKVVLDCNTLQPISHKIPTKNFCKETIIEKDGKIKYDLEIFPISVKYENEVFLSNLKPLFNSRIFGTHYGCCHSTNYIKSANPNNFSEILLCQSKKSNRLPVYIRDTFGEHFTCNPLVCIELEPLNMCTRNINADLHESISFFNIHKNHKDLKCDLRYFLEHKDKLAPRQENIKTINDNLVR